ncbi:MAG: bifunctional diguanylate cyclase/phosphodiesterase [Neptuniibacter sp.]
MKGNSGSGNWVPENMNARTMLLSLALFCCLTAGVGVLLYYQQMVSSQNYLEEESTQTTADLIAAKIDTILEDYVTVINIMTTLPDVVTGLDTEDQQTVMKSKYLLYQFCNKTIGSLCYLLKPNGDVLIDNRGPTEKTLEGKNYSFRPYFKDALQFGASIYAALGTVTNKRGIYFSKRIQNEYFETLGVGVIKVPMEGLEQVMNSVPGNAVLIDPDGVIFSSTQKDWLLNTLWSIDSDLMRNKVESKQFGLKPLKSLNFSHDLGQKSLVNEDKTKRYILGVSEISHMPGWRLLYMTMPQNGIGVSYIPIVSSLFLVTALAALLLYKVGCKDLTRRRVAEVELMASEKRLRQLTEITNEGIVIHQEGKVLDCNKAVEEIFGRVRNDLIGRDIWSLMAPESIGLAVQNMMDGYEQPYDIEGKRSDGEIFPMEICARSSAMRGQNVGFFCIRDTSQTQQLILERLHRSIIHADETSTSFAVIYIDLDNFKRFNDSLGHQFGDKLLTATTRRLRCGLTDKDSLIRHGGDEFIVLLGEITSPEQMCEAVDRLNSLCKQEFTIDQRNVHLSATFGVALYPNHGETSKVLLQNSEIAMHKCREEGLQGQYAFYSDKMSYEAGQRLDIELHLRKAIEKHELYLNYQPVYKKINGKLSLSSAEVLVRWKSAELGFIGPDKFITIAESTGLIIEIGYWIIRNACLQGIKWIRSGLPPFKLAINISPQQLKKPTFIEDLKLILDETGFPESLLCFEITEGLLIEDDQYAKVILNKLKDFGISLSMDDFGTGYSSLSYLKNYPFDTLKVDRSFVMGLENEHSNQQLVKASIMMAHGMSLNVIAEGVETAEQLAFLEKNDCDFFQGYLLNRPLAESTFQDHLNFCKLHPDGFKQEQLSS